MGIRACQSRVAWLLLPLPALIGGAAAAPMGPEHIEWRLMTLGEVAVPMLPGGRQPSIKLDPEQKKVTGYTGCNNFFGTYDLSGSALKFGPLAATRRACPEPASTVETKYLEALAGVRVWKIADGWLLLQNDGVILARFSNDTAAVSTPNLESLTLRASAYRKDPVTLTRGEYRAPAAPGSASEVVVRLTDNRLFGSLNGKETGAVVLTTSLGGTGTYYELALLFRKDDSWTHADSVPLGDRVKVHSVTIENGQILVAMTTHGPKDPLCCPTVASQKRFSVRDQRLVPVTAAGGVESPALAGTAWQWVHTRYNNDQRTIPARPEQYTLRFRDDGQIGVKADCNMKGGTYAATDKQLSMKIITSTMAVCPPGSLEEEFVRNLHAGTNYFFRDGDLFIDLKFDSGTMRFSPDGRH